ncbi:hypothetical protein K431DRAFT_44152 [Polychaeton citri CBS 116435]|uniref:Uncharacterized protein n=1 Tax=Polychaeton citri CBS 116435 TaxID=1314669 RepID=A0A9P4UNK1_9PEZI|nr:hypothetical protein K431DRAFT_44152 [Polychaeton citri CBS 116435]
MCTCREQWQCRPNALARKREHELKPKPQSSLRCTALYCTVLCCAAPSMYCQPQAPSRHSHLSQVSLTRCLEVFLLSLFVRRTRSGRVKGQPGLASPGQSVSVTAVTMMADCVDGRARDGCLVCESPTRRASGCGVGPCLPSNTPHLTLSEAVLPGFSSPHSAAPSL